MSHKSNKKRLTLPGFFPLVPNEIYVGKSTTADLREVIALEINSPPTEDDVVKYLQQKAAEMLEHQKFSGNPLIRGEQNRQLLENIMGEMSEDKLLGITLGREGVVSLLKANTPAPHPNKYFIGRRYVVVDCGFLPGDIIAKRTRDRRFYEEAMDDPELQQRVLGQRFNFRILIDNDTKQFPEKERIVSLVREGVHGSPIFNVGNFCYNRQVVENIVHSLYGALSEPRRFERLRDTTEVSLVKYSLNSASVLNDYDPSVYRSTTSGLFGRDPAPHPDVLKERMLDNKLN